MERGGAKTQKLPHGTIRLRQTPPKVVPLTMEPGDIVSIWPWLIQMGYGRAGWYSYDAMDMKGSSAAEIRPDLQHVAPGEIMPTHPGGGFLVKTVEPEHSLVLYSDTELVRSQQAAAQSAGTDELPTPGLKASGAMLSASYPDFAVSWAFVALYTVLQEIAYIAMLFGTYALYRSARLRTVWPVTAKPLS